MARMGGQDGSSVIINVTGELVVIFIPLFLQRSDLRIDYSIVVNTSALNHVIHHLQSLPLVLVRPL